MSSLIMPPVKIDEESPDRKTKERAMGVKRWRGEREMTPFLYSSPDIFKAERRERERENGISSFCFLFFLSTPSQTKQKNAQEAGG